MRVDLLTSELRARGAVHEVTSRAELYLATGLPLGQVLDALKISRATWYRRVDALRAWEAENRSAARATSRPAVGPAVESAAVEAVRAAIEDVPLPGFGDLGAERG